MEAGHVCKHTFLLMLLAVGVLAGSSPGPAEPPATAPALDARFVRMEVPGKVTADQVFPVKITMKNTGRATWAEGICLYS